MEHARCHSTAVIIDRKIHVIGGRCEDDRLQVHEVYDPYAQRWSEMAPMLCRRSSLSLSRIGWKLFAFGGFDGNEENSSAEWYDILRDRWDWLKPMPCSLSQAACITIDDNVYLIGGCSRKGADVHNSVLAYNVVTSEYSTATPPMLRKRVSCCAFRIDPHTICAAGGSDGFHTHDTTEIFDIRANKWSMGPKLSEARVNACLILDSDEQAILIGGFRQRAQLRSCEELQYTPETHTWNKMKFSLNVGRDAPSGVLWQ
jgi:hypothetical protein